MSTSNSRESRIAELERQIEEAKRKLIFEANVEKLKFQKEDVEKPNPWNSSEWGTTITGRWIKYEIVLNESGSIVDFSEMISAKGKLQISDPFNNGAFRFASYCRLTTDYPIAGEPQKERVGKTQLKAFSPEEEREACITDIKSHLTAQILAKRYSEKTKTVTGVQLRYCEAEIFEVSDREKFMWRYITLEELLPNFNKFNNNAGYVSLKSLSNTSQCFSHFTWHETKHNLVVVDIQGSTESEKESKRYTLSDPAIHFSRECNKYDLSNRGEPGIADFFRTHLCNSLCEYLKLDRHDAQPEQSDKNEGATIIRDTCHLRGKELKDESSFTSLANEKLKLSPVANKKLSPVGTKLIPNCKRSAPVIYNASVAEESAKAPKKLAPVRKEKLVPMPVVKKKLLPVATKKSAPDSFDDIFGDSHTQTHDSILDDIFGETPAPKKFDLYDDIFNPKPAPTTELHSSDDFDLYDDIFNPEPAPKKQILTPFDLYDDIFNPKPAPTTELHSPDDFNDIFS